MGDRDEILRKLKKLQAHATSAEAIGSEAEAQAFAAKITQLIAQHQIDRAELEAQDLADEEDLNPIEQVCMDYRRVKLKRKRVPWQYTLAVAVGDGHYCSLLITPKVNTVWFVGRKVQAEMARETYSQLCETAEQIADKEYVKYFYECKAAGNVYKARGFRQSFLEGFAYRVKLKFWEALKAAEEEAARVKGALVLFKTDADKIREFLEDFGTDYRIEKLKKQPLDMKPTLKFQWKNLKRWGLFRGKKTLVSLHMTEEDAKAAKKFAEDEEDKEWKPLRSGKDNNREGRARGEKVAGSLDLGHKSRKDLAS